MCTYNACKCVDIIYVALPCTKGAAEVPRYQGICTAGATGTCRLITADNHVAVDAFVQQLPDLRHVTRLHRGQQQLLQAPGGWMGCAGLLVVPYC